MSPGCIGGIRGLMIPHAGLLLQDALMAVTD